MRVLVCGDRDWVDRLGYVDSDLGFIEALLFGLAALGDCHKMDDPPLTIIEGGARGADQAAAEWVRQFQPDCGCGCSVQLLSFPPDWVKHGKAAGPIRNQQMLDEGRPDIVVALHDDLIASKGTKDMVQRAKKAGIPVYLVSRP